MAVTLDRLKSQLLTSGLQQQNFALFQVIDQLIRFLSDQAQFVEASLGSSSGGGGGVISDPTYLTKDNEIATLPNSRQMLAGQGIQFNDAGGRRIISTAIPFAIESEEREEGLFAPEGIRVSSPSRRASIEESGFPPSDIEECIVEGLLGIQGIQASPGSAPDSSIVIMGNLPGIDGEDGEEGFIGPVGPQGVVGPQGLIGPPGLDGTDTEKEIFLLGTSIVGSHNLLSVTHPDTLAHPCVRGDLIVGGAAVWEPFPVGLDGQFIGTDGVDPIWMYIASTDLSDTLNIARLDASNTFNQINPLITPAESWIGPSATAGIYFKGGNVGIGTTAPGSLLSVNGNVRLSSTVASSRYILMGEDAETNTGTGVLVMQAGAGSQGYGGAINLFAHSHATKPGWVTVGLSTSAGSGATEGRFTVNNQAIGGGTDVFTVLRTGNVGIGISPSYKLDVNGDSNFRAAAYFSSGSAGYISWSGSNDLIVSSSNILYLCSGSTTYFSMTSAGQPRFYSLGAFAASDKYVVADANGNLHVSATGPAS